MNSTTFHPVLLAITLSFLCGDAAAAVSEKEFAKCQKMLARNAAWILKQGDKARRSLDEQVDSLVSKHISDNADPGPERARITAIVDELMARYEPEAYRQELIDEAADELINTENNENFVCWYESAVRGGLKMNLRRYENRLEEIEDAVKDRIDIENIAPDEGLVVILFYARGWAQNVSINRLGGIGGRIRFGPVTNGEYFRVLKVKAGTYRWHSIWNKTWGGRMTAHLKRSEFDFEVEAGRLNFTGAFVYKSDYSMGYSIDVIDRTSVLLSLLENRYKDLLGRVEINNGIHSDNRFIEYYLREKEVAHVEDDSA